MPVLRATGNEDGPELRRLQRQPGATEETHLSCEEEKGRPMANGSATTARGFLDLIRRVGPAALEQMPPLSAAEEAATDAYVDECYASSYAKALNVTDPQLAADIDALMRRRSGTQVQA